MQIKDIISTLMLSDFYFSLPLWERKQVVARLLALYGSKLQPACTWPGSLNTSPQNETGFRTGN